MYSVGLNEHEHFARGERQKIWNGGGWKSWIHWAQHKCWSKDGGDQLFRLLLAFDESSHGCIYWVETVTSVRNGSHTASNTMHLLVWGVCCSLLRYGQSHSHLERWGPVNVTIFSSIRRLCRLSLGWSWVWVGFHLQSTNLIRRVISCYMKNSTDYESIRLMFRRNRKVILSSAMHILDGCCTVGQTESITNTNLLRPMKNAEMKCSSIRTAIYEAADWSFRIQSHPTFCNRYMPIIRPWPLWKNRPGATFSGLILMQILKTAFGHATWCQQQQHDPVSTVAKIAKSKNRSFVPCLSGQ